MIRFTCYKVMGSYLGQNFLIDAKVRSYIAEHIAKLYKEFGCEALIEIGPGKGAITKLIEGISGNFFVIEKDFTLVESGELRVEDGTIIQGDILEVDIEKMLGAGSMEHVALSTKKTLVVGNLPYYITSPILRKFFGNPAKDGASGSQQYAGGVFMLQDEVGQKLRHDAKKKSYLRRLINYAYKVTYLKGVPAKCFKPAPKVKSCLVEISSKYQVSSIKWEDLIKFLDMFAPFSRKTLGAIEKIIDKRFADKSPAGDKSSHSLTTKSSNFVIPEELKKKRLEELSFEEIDNIMNNE